LSRLSNVSRKMGKCQFFIAICLIVMNAWVGNLSGNVRRCDDLEGSRGMFLEGLR
jgi:hypothetical protein